jgi:integral membrane protein
VTQRRAQLRRLEFASVIEGTTLILLAGVAVPLKHLGGWPVGVQVLGPLHGLALLIYLWIAMQAVAEAGWSRSDVIRVFLVAVLPFGGFFNAAFISRKIAGLEEGAVPMSLVALYPWLKALHVASALIFAAGVMTVAAFLWAAARSGQDVARISAALRAWDRAVTTPAMLLVLVLGFLLARSGGWFGARGCMSSSPCSPARGRARHAVRKTSPPRRRGPPQGAWRASPLLLAGFAGIAMLAVLQLGGRHPPDGQRATAVLSAL